MCFAYLLVDVALCATMYRCARVYILGGTDHVGSRACLRL